MTPTLTAEQIGELEALLAKATPGPWSVFVDGQSACVMPAMRKGDICTMDMPSGNPENADFVAAIRNAAPALIAMADRTSRAEMAGKWSSDVASMAIQDKERAEAEVATLLGRLKSTESALDRAMARSNSWREEAAKLQAQMLADKGRHIAETTASWQPIETAPRDGTEILAYSETGGTGVMLVRHIAMSDFLTDGEIEEFIKDGASEEMLDTPDWFFADFIHGDRLPEDCYPSHWMPVPAETPRTCETCQHQEVIKQARTRRHPCWTCAPGISKYPGWTPKPIPSTTDKGEKP